MVLLATARSDVWSRIVCVPERQFMSLLTLAGISPSGEYFEILNPLVGHFLIFSYEVLCPCAR